MSEFTGKYDDKVDGLSDGPFGFGKSVKLKAGIEKEPDQCLIHYKWAEDDCARDPISCSDGLTVSIWEKNTFPVMVLAEMEPEQMEPKYLVSSGASFNRETATAIPGFSIYRKGPNLYGVLSTGEMVWELVVTGQLFNATWMAVALRWKKPDLTDTVTPVSRLGGLEMYVNGEMVGRTLIAVTENKGGTTKFNPIKTFKINGKEPPVITVGCGWNYDQNGFDYHAGGEYDELAIWTRQLINNASLNELPFMMGGYSPDFEEVDANAFNAMVGNVDLESDNQAGLAQEVLEAMLLGAPTTTPDIPTRTRDPDLTQGPTTPVVTTTTTEADIHTSNSPTTIGSLEMADCEKYKTEQNSTQNALQTMLNAECSESRTPEEADMRYAMAKVAAKILSGEENNTRKWKCVEDLAPNEEGAPKTLRQIEQYMLSFVGCVNISVDTSESKYFDVKKNVLNFRTYGDDFVMNVDKMAPETLREGIRRKYPNYEGPEWQENNKTWENPKDTFTVPTGMFIDNPKCNDKPVTMSATILNGYGEVAPKRKNPTYIRAKEWKVDSKVISVKVSVNPDSVLYDRDYLDNEGNVQNSKKDALGCAPNKAYMQENPIRATLYHKKEGHSRITRRRNLLWHTNMERKGIEVRQCAWWNEGYSYNGAWDPSACRLKETDDFKTICECSEFGAIAVIVEMSEHFEVNDKCTFEELVKYGGIAISIGFLLLFCVMVMTRKYIDDMFHSLRTHVCLTWILAMVMHIVTDLHNVRESEHMNLYVGLVMIYLYTSCATWIVCEAHAIFKALTSGIISGRAKIYVPFGYGTPITIIGVLFLLFANELGTDPRCFIAWDDIAKSVYFYYMFGLTITGVVFAFIILFNLKRPQTKRLNIIADLVSQARGTIYVSICNFLLWLFAYMTYMRNPESDLPNFYCEFIMVLGFFGLLVIFVGYGLMSKRFRHGLRGKNAAMAAKYKVAKENHVKSSPTSLSRPSTSASQSNSLEAQSEAETVSQVGMTEEDATKAEVLSVTTIVDEDNSEKNEMEEETIESQTTAKPETEAPADE